MNHLRLTKTKIWLLVSLLVVFIGGGIVFFATNHSTYQSRVEQTPTDPLTSQRQQMFSQVQTQLVNYPTISETVLCRTLKNLYSANTATNFTNLISYLQTAHSAEELADCQEKIQQTLHYLVPNPPQPDPGPKPVPPPESKWEKNLREIRDFVSSSPPSLQKVKDWLQDKNYPDPLAGVNLAGIGINELKKMPDNGKILGLDKEDPASEEYGYKDYVYLSAAGEGNCYLHSFSIFLTGQNQVLVEPLRVAMCLELMKNLDKFCPFLDEAEKLRYLKSKLISDKMATNYAWLDGEDSEFLAHVLKRPIAVINKQGGIKPGSDFGKFQLIPYPDIAHASSKYFASIKKYDEQWVVYNSGGHFQPLIKK